MNETETACQSRNGSFPDHDLWDDGYGYECRRCGVSLDELDDED